MLGFCCCTQACYSCIERDCSSLQYTGFSLQRVLLLWSTGYRYVGFSGCSAQVQYLWHMDLVAPWYVVSSRTRDQIHVPCTGSGVLIHCSIRKSCTMVSDQSFRMVKKDTLHKILIRTYTPSAVRKSDSWRLHSWGIWEVRPLELGTRREVASLNHTFFPTSRPVLEMKIVWVDHDKSWKL